MNNKPNDGVVSGGRTRGDGMETVDSVAAYIKTKAITQSLASEATDVNQTIDSGASSATIPGAFSIYRPNDELRKTVKLPAKIPQGKLFYLVPHLIDTNRSFALKNKEPRFIPFEPYKAAVSMGCGCCIFIEKSAFVIFELLMCC